MQSEIKIKVSFDVDDLPEYKTKTTSSGVKLVKAATGYRGWVRNPQMFLAGEGGEEEYISITPKSQMTNRAAITEGGGIGEQQIQVIVNINGNDIIDSRKITKLIRDVAGRNISRML
ncbi:MAG: hypothetical protein CV087_11130 [Candidatus Brocadia sp. WS118]|nr:MAG: hypothetical protein CV087_11130 [Candidatus Brocadia sp. WS118]